jgi:hypothetical protein
MLNCVYNFLHMANHTIFPKIKVSRRLRGHPVFIAQHATVIWAEKHANMAWNRVGQGVK